MSKAIESLDHEHRIIEKVLAAISITVEKINSGKEPDKILVKKIYEFMKVYADRCHHGKEETHLFKLLEKTGVPTTGCPLGALIHEHQKARALVGQLSEANDYRTALPALQGIIDLYPGHIWKEDYLLFPMSEKILNAQQLKELNEEFEKVENEIGPDTHGKYEALAKELFEQCQTA